MRFIIKPNGKYWEIQVQNGPATINLGLLNEKERKELAKTLRAAANFIDPQEGA